MKAFAPSVLFFHIALLTLVASGAEPSKANSGVPHNPRPERPNIIFILADDLGYGDVQCYNPQRGKIATPQIDRLAQQGMRFTDAHTASSVCTPTRYSVLTGRYAWRTRLQSGVLEGFSPPLIASNRMTVASLLKSRGYQTACFGKWHLGMDWAKKESATTNKSAGSDVDWSQPIRNGPTSAGFDYYYGIAASLDMPPFVFIENDRVTSVPNAVKKWVRTGPAAESFEAENVIPELTRSATNWLTQRAAERAPFFVYLAFSSPHTPVVPTKEWQGKSGLTPYADFVMETDSAVGAVLAAVDRAGMGSNTLIFFSSDNGCSPAAGTRGLEQLGHFPSGPWRGYKADIWEGGHRVPFIARWPGKIAAGATSDETICLGDLLATSAAIVGATLPDNAGEDSVSILPALRGEKLSQPLREATVHHSIRGQFAIRQGPWKLAFCPGSGGWAAPHDDEARKQALPELQLYNLAADPGETNNLQAAEPQVVKRLTQLMNRFVAQGRSTPGTRQTNDVAVAIRTDGPRVLPSEGGYNDGKQWKQARVTDTDPKLPRVLLIGDSVANGYHKEVAEALKGVANLDLWMTPKNVANPEMIPHLRSVLKHGPYAVIHFNDCGLHAWQSNAIPEGKYGVLFAEFVAALKTDAGGAKLIWASSTPVTAKGKPGELDAEINVTVAEHNRAAREVIEKQGITINDLYALMLDKLNLARGDRWHWTPPGQAIQADAVAAAIRSVLPTTASRSTAAANRPNILLILADDMGYGDVHALNPERGKIPTPNLDRLAAQSMVFTDAHSGSSVCTPTRYGVLTGRYAWRTHLQKGILQNTSPALIAEDRLTLPGMLKGQGYRTAGFGKWHLGQDAPLTNGNYALDQALLSGPNTRGFDYHFGSDLRFFAPFMFVENGRFIGTPLFNRTQPGAKHGAGTPLKPDDFSHILPTVCDRAIAKLKEFAASPQPFFMYFAPCAPHDPFVPTDAWKGRSGLSVYADYVMETDAEFGRLLAALEQTGLATNTLVFLASDNGCAPYTGVKDMEAKGHFPSADKRGYKSDIWDGGHHVPFMARWPGKIRAGTTNSQTICLTDFMATCAEVVGAKLPDNAGEDSVSLLPSLLGRPQPPKHDAVVHHSIDGNFAIREGKWKLIFCSGSGGWSQPKSNSKAGKELPPVQLYDVVADPGEQRNLQAEKPEVVKRLIALMEKYIADGRSTLGAKQANDVEVAFRKSVE